jgi:hypothetical protein
LVESSKQSDIDFNNTYAVLDKQFNNGIDISIFYNDIQKLSDDNQKRKIESEKEGQKDPADYYLELFLSLLLVSFWLLYFSTQDWCIAYLFGGLFPILFLSNYQNRFFYKFVRAYSRFMSRVFPIKSE